MNEWIVYLFAHWVLCDTILFIQHHPCIKYVLFSKLQCFSDLFAMVIHSFHAFGLSYDFHLVMWLEYENSVVSVDSDSQNTPYAIRQTPTHSHFMRIQPELFEWNANRYWCDLFRHHSIYFLLTPCTYCIPNETTFHKLHGEFHISQ